PRGDDEQEFNSSEYTAAKENYIALKREIREEEIEAIGRRSETMAATLRQIIDIDRGSYTRLGEIPRRLIAGDMTKLRSLERKGLITITQRERNIES
ncbi:MAG: hypothetical protein SNG35_04905, partial [Rikenellaceae bacterium]